MNPNYDDAFSFERLSANAKSLLATVRHLLTGSEIQACEAFACEESDPEELAFTFAGDLTDFPNEKKKLEDARIVLNRKAQKILSLANQFPKEIYDHQLADALEYSRSVVERHRRLAKHNPAILSH